MSRPVKKFYRFLAAFFSVTIAAGTFIGCGTSTKYGPPIETKYGPPPPSGYNKKIKVAAVENKEKVNFEMELKQ